VSQQIATVPYQLTVVFFLKESKCMVHLYKIQDTTRAMPTDLQGTAPSLVGSTEGLTKERKNHHSGPLHLRQNLFPTTHFPYTLAAQSCTNSASWQMQGSPWLMLCTILTFIAGLEIFHGWRAEILGVHLLAGS